jgi:hypothetical protein
MKKDITFRPVEGISVAVARKKNELDAFSWNVYLINKNDFALKDILISSKGYGMLNGEEQQTSVLRHHISLLGPGENIIVEPIDPAIFHLTNEYWVSYFVEGQIFDKRFIFVPESIIEKNLIFIPDLSLEGILHT